MARLINNTDLDTKTLRELVRATLGERSAFRAVRVVQVTRLTPGCDRDLEGSVDGLADIDMKYIKLMIPNSWKVISGKRTIDFVQTLLHEIEHILSPHLHHRHMHMPWNFNVPFAKGKVVSS